ncbi:MAG: HAD-IIIC family phosphatase [Lentisphaeria bacterium]|jgi:FkbH-like protein|nr:HAD-IIIC family phosphatase [Lentisphaeria bacterium]
MSAIAITATFTAEPVGEILDFWLTELDIPGTVAFARYSQVFQELLDDSGLIASNRGGLNVVLVRLADWRETAGAVDDFIAAISAAAATATSPLLVVLCPSPQPQTSDEQRIAAALAPVAGVRTIAAEQLCRRLRSSQIHDTSAEQAGHVPYTDLFFAELGTAIVRHVYDASRPPLKVIVLDCDNTLWTGVCGEDGPDGVVIDEPRRQLQSFMVAQHDAGRLLCLCSKNHQADVDAVFDCREMPLASEHIAASRINWNAKSANLTELAAELKLGLDSFVFVDDNPVECAEVQAGCPEVTTINLPDNPELLGEFLDNLWIFDRSETTAEDGRRTAMYRAEKERHELRRQTLTIGDFLEGLQLVADIRPMTDEDVERVAQMTQRTNQFNFTTQRLDAAQVRAMQADPASTIAVVDVSDRFGDYGVVGLMIYHSTAAAIVVDTLLMSCRTLGRGVEHRMLAHLGEQTQAAGLGHLELPFKPTDRNEPARTFAEAVAGGFRGDGDREWLYRIPAAAAVGVRYAPSSAPAPPDSTEPQKSPGAATHVATGLAVTVLVTRIATELGSPEAVLTAVHAAAVRQRAAFDFEFVGPQTETEKRIAFVWATVLRLDRVGVDDNFFDLGGDSLRIVSAHSRLQEEFATDFPVTKTFQYPTVRALAGYLDDARRDPPQFREARERGRRQREVLAQKQGWHRRQRSRK